MKINFRSSHEGFVFSIPLMIGIAFIIFAALIGISQGFVEVGGLLVPQLITDMPTFFDYDDTTGDIIQQGIFYFFDAINSYLRKFLGSHVCPLTINTEPSQSDVSCHGASPCDILVPSLDVRINKQFLVSTLCWFAVCLIYYLHFVILLQNNDGLHKRDDCRYPLLGDDGPEKVSLVG